MAFSTAHLLTATVLLVAFQSTQVQAARILGILPHYGKSHFFVFEPLFKELASRGHDVHVVSHFPQEKPLKNYTDISLKGSVTSFEAVGGFSFELIGNPSIFNDMMTSIVMSIHGAEDCDKMFQFSAIQNLLNSNERFDLVFSEIFTYECFLGFAHKFQAHHISLSSSNGMPWSNARFGNPDHPSYIPNIFGPFSSHMTFLERAANVAYNAVFKTMFHVLHNWPCQLTIEKYFGDSTPSIEQLQHNTSLMLVNSYITMQQSRPLVPSVVEIGGIHVKPPKKLPEELDRWINASTHGVIYFSMGSMLISATLPPEKKAAILAAFKELPQRVLWKYEEDTLPDKPDNVRISKWFPQRDILNHPNVRLFISHAGLLGAIEAVLSAVPILGIPMFGDQQSNCESLREYGAAICMKFGLLTKETLLLQMNDILNNTSYHESAKRLSKQYLDRPLSPMETAIFWIEYVLRHNGAHHLRSSAMDLAWYQYLLLDVALAYIVAFALVLAINTYLCRKIICMCKRILFSKHKDRKIKQN